MKQLITLILLIGLLSCNNQSSKIKTLQNRIDSLETKLTHIYKPGFGVLMSNIQAHHSKLWFAGNNKNWNLAQYEVKELKEIIADILKYQNEREESELIEMINPAIDSLNIAIKQQNSKSFENSYLFLTELCNNCHQSTNFEYNLVKVPKNSPFTNQDFKSLKSSSFSE